MSILIFLLVLFILVLVHEWGHFIVAKKTGMRVDEFGIGFPPKLWGVKKGETEYTLNSLPIGGFVRIWGENYDDLKEDSTLDNSRAFSARPKWAQALVLVAGVTMNILFAWLLFSITFMTGVQTTVEESVATAEAEMYVIGILPDSPAEVLELGSVIKSVSANNETILNPKPSQFTEAITAASDSPVEVVYEYRGEEKTVSIQPESGLIDDGSDKYAIGVSLSMVETTQESFFTAITHGFFTTIEGLKAITIGLFSLIAEAIVGDADFSQVSGPVGIVGMVGDAASFGLVPLLTFTAIISLNLAVINLLPFPALDGGRLVFVAIEAVTRKRIPAVWAGRVNLVGFGLLMILMIAVTYNDIVKLF